MRTPIIQFALAVALVGAEGSAEPQTRTLFVTGGLPEAPATGELQDCVHAVRAALDHDRGSLTPTDDASKAGAILRLSTCKWSATPAWRRLRITGTLSIRGQSHPLNEQFQVDPPGDAKADRERLLSAYRQRLESRLQKLLGS